LCGGLLALHLAYYLVFLNQFDEHRRLVAQWRLPRLLQMENFIPAYALVGGLAAWSARRLTLAKPFFDVGHNRLFLVWLVVAFALANHEFAMDPVQPLHFERGYIWTSLFLLGIPALLRLFDYLRERLTRRAAAVCTSLVLALLLSDNVVWLATYTARPTSGFWITRNERQLFR
jgi:predicted small integral membrane protein